MRQLSEVEMSYLRVGLSEHMYDLDKRARDECSQLLKEMYGCNTMYIEEIKDTNDEV
jgi:hypothetical protein